MRHDEKSNDKPESLRDRQFDRRRFLGAAGAAGTAMVVSSGLGGLFGIPPAHAAAVPFAGAVQPMFQPGTLSNITNFVSIRHIGPFQDVNTTWARLTQFALSQGIVGSNVVAFATACPCDDINAPVAAATAIPVKGANGVASQLNLVYDACLAISPQQHQFVTQGMAVHPGANFDGIRAGAMSVNETMVVVHRGSYASIGDTYRAALAAGATLGTSPDGENLPVAFEVYKNNPLLTKPEALITEIHFPLSVQSLRSKALQTRG